MRLVNKYQTKEERRRKYKLAKEKGFNPNVSRAIRDFSIKAFERFLKYKKPELYNPLYTK